MNVNFLPGMDVYEEQQAEEDEDCPVFTKSKAPRKRDAGRCELSPVSLLEHRVEEKKSVMGFCLCG